MFLIRYRQRLHSQCFFCIQETQEPASNDAGGVPSGGIWHVGELLNNANERHRCVNTFAFFVESVLQPVTVDISYCFKVIQIGVLRARIQLVSATLVLGVVVLDCSLLVSSSHASLGVLYSSCFMGCR